MALGAGASMGFRGPWVRAAAGIGGSVAAGLDPTGVSNQLMGGRLGDTLTRVSNATGTDPGLAILPAALSAASNSARGRALWGATSAGMMGVAPRNENGPFAGSTVRDMQTSIENSVGESLRMYGTNDTVRSLEELAKERGAQGAKAREILSALRRKGY